MCQVSYSYQTDQHKQWILLPHQVTYVWYYKDLVRLSRFGQKLEWLVIIYSNKKVVQIDLEIDSRIADAGNSDPRQLKDKVEELESNSDLFLFITSFYPLHGL
jgi:hypothetical protein